MREHRKMTMFLSALGESQCMYIRHKLEIQGKSQQGQVPKSAGVSDRGRIGKGSKADRVTEKWAD